MLSDLVHERFSSAMHWRQLTVLVEAVILLGVALLPAECNMLANGLTSLACGMQVEDVYKRQWAWCSLSLQSIAFKHTPRPPASLTLKLGSPRETFE